MRHSHTSSAFPLLHESHPFDQKNWSHWAHRHQKGSSGATGAQAWRCSSQTPTPGSRRVSQWPSRAEKRVGGRGREKQNSERAPASRGQVSLLRERKTKPSASPRRGTAGRDGTGREGTGPPALLNAVRRDPRCSLRAEPSPAGSNRAKLSWVQSYRAEPDRAEPCRAAPRLTEPQRIPPGPSEPQRIPPGPSEPQRIPPGLAGSRRAEPCPWARWSACRWRWRRRCWRRYAGGWERCAGACHPCPCPCPAGGGFRLTAPPPRRAPGGSGSGTTRPRRPPASITTSPGSATISAASASTRPRPPSCCPWRRPRGGWRCSRRRVSAGKERGMRGGRVPAGPSGVGEVIPVLRRPRSLFTSLRSGTDSGGRSGEICR